MTNVILFSQNLILYSLKRYSDLFPKDNKNIILTTCVLFENEKTIISGIIKNAEYYTFADYLSDYDMQQCDERAFSNQLRDHDEYVEHVKYEKNKLVCEKVNKQYGPIHGYLLSAKEDLGICEKVWLNYGFKMLKKAQFYYNVSSFSKLRSKIKDIKPIADAYYSLKNRKEKAYIEPKYVHVYEENGYKYVMVGKLHRIDYRLDKEFKQSDEECRKLNEGIFYSGEEGQYMTPWHEHSKCIVPDEEMYDVRWIQDGYLPSNYSDYTYHFKPSNVIYDVWDINGSLLFKNKMLPYEMLPFRKKLYLPTPKFPSSISTILVATSATGDWTALKNRSDDDYLVIAFAKIAKLFPNIRVVYRCHPDWILPNTVGVNSIDRVIDYFDYLHLDNLVLSSNIPNAKEGDGYIQSFSRSSLEEDLKAADIVFGEHSISIIDAGFRGIPFCSVNLSGRRNLFESITNLGFPHCESIDDIINILEMISTQDFQEKYNRAVNKYNEMTDIESL